MESFAPDATRRPSGPKATERTGPAWPLSSFRIYSYGALSTTIRRQLGWVDKQSGAGSDAPTDVVTAEEEGEFVRLRRKNWARLIQKIWQNDPEVCESCGEKMRVISAITHPHQDDVIERILRSRDAWDPPWKRPRRARGPPRQLDLFGDEGSQLPTVEEEDVNQDLPATGWES